MCCTPRACPDPRHVARRWDPLFPPTCARFRAPRHRAPVQRGECGRGLVCLGERTRVRWAFGKRNLVLAQQPAEGEAGEHGKNAPDGQGGGDQRHPEHFRRGATAIVAAHEPDGIVNSCHIRCSTRIDVYHGVSRTRSARSEVVTHRRSVTFGRAHDERDDLLARLASAARARRARHSCAGRRRRLRAHRGSRRRRRQRAR